MITTRNCDTGIHSLRKKLGKKAADFVERLKSGSPINMPNDEDAMNINTQNASTNKDATVSVFKGQSNTGSNSRAQLTEPSMAQYSQNSLPYSVAKVRGSRVRLEHDVTQMHNRI